MRSRYPVKQTMDLVAGRRVFNGCWLSASFGISIMHMLFLAQAWHVSQHALVPAFMMSFWTLGALIGACVRDALRRWGGSWFVCALLWFGGTFLVPWRLSLDALPPALLSIVTLVTVALLLGASSTAWLSQQRSWPSVGERTALVRSLVGFTIGLVVVWLLPTWAGLIALTCCLPMLALDSCLHGAALSPHRVELLPTGSADTGLPTGGNCSWMNGRCPGTGGGLAPQLHEETSRSRCCRAALQSCWEASGEPSRRPLQQG